MHSLNLKRNSSNFSFFNFDYILIVFLFFYDNYPAFTKNSTVTIITAKITAYNRQSYYNLGQKYTLTVYETEGVLAKGALVVVKVNGKEFTSVKTNEKGVATFTITQAPGTYVLTMTSLGKSVSKSLKVKHSVTLKTVKVKKSAKKLVLTATVCNKNKVLRHKKATFKFNGKECTTKTDK